MLALYNGLFHNYSLGCCTVKGEKVLVVILMKWRYIFHALHLVQIGARGEIIEGHGGLEKLFIEQIVVGVDSVSGPVAGIGSQLVCAVPDLIFVV